MLIVRFVNQNSLLKKSKVTNGTIHTNSTNNYIIIEYLVQGKSHLKKYHKKPYCELNEGDLIKVNYLEKNPTYSSPQICDVNLTIPSYNIVALFYILVADLLIGITMFNDKTTFDKCFYIIICVCFLITVIAWFLDESKYKNSDKTIDGTIVVAQKNKGKETFIAKYSIEGNEYYTREMVIPLTKLRKEYLVGDKVVVKFASHNPYRSIIIDDEYPYKKAKSTIIITSVFIAVLIVFYIILSRFSLLYRLN